LNILEFVEQLRTKIKMQADNDKDKGIIRHGVVKVCEYTPQRISPVGRITIEEDNVIIYGNDVEGWFADTRWTPEDVMAEVAGKDKEITREQAITFLENNSRYIVDAMVRAGFEAITALMDYDSLPPIPEGR